MPVPIKYLEGRLVYLRPFEPQDGDWFWPLVNNDVEGRRLTGTPGAFTRAEITDYIARQATDPSRVSFVIARQADDVPVGEVVLNDIQPRSRSASLRVFIGAAHTGEGLGSEAIGLMLDYGFGMANLHRIELDVYTKNERALHVYEKLGFRREGVKRQNWYYDHRYYDSIVMSILEHEYRAD